MYTNMREIGIRWYKVINQMSIGSRIDKEVVVCIHNGILLSYKKECI